MLSRALKMAFWVTYDHLGKLILANLLWAMAVTIAGIPALGALLSPEPGVALVIGAPSAVICFGLVMPVMSVGLAYMAKELIEKKDGTVGDLFRGIRLYWSRAAALGLCYIGAVVCLVTSAWFYATRLRDTMPWLGYTISGLAVWGLLFLGVMSVLVMPALVHKRGRVVETLKLTALLTLDNPVLALGLALQVAAFTALAVVLMPVFFFLYGSVVIVMGACAYEVLARKYQSAAPEGGAPTPPDDEQDDYLNRGLRDFLFPWKG